MNHLIFVLQLLLGLTLLALAFASIKTAGKLATVAPLFPKSRLSRIAISGLLAAAGILTLLGSQVPFAVFFAGCLSLLLSVWLALLALRSHSVRLVLVPLLVAAASTALAVAQPLGLKVLALPKADDLPVVAAPAQVVKTYEEGLWFEGIAADRSGTLYLAGNRGLDFSRADYYRQSHGEVLERKPDGQERVLFKTPAGSTAGVIAVSEDGTLYMTSHGDSSAIWKIQTTGQSAKLADFPEGAWPNGIDIGPDGMLYSPDSALGVIWRLDPATGNVKQVAKDDRLMARAFVSLAPGANGLHFDGHDMYVTVSDRTTILKYVLDTSGQLASPVVVATGIPGDDFAIGRDGSLFVTTHPYNTVVRVRPGGAKTIIGNQEQHIIGATDAVFGTGSDDQEVLYVVTDGGAFTGGPKTRGQLVALRPYGQ